MANTNPKKTVTKKPTQKSIPNPRNNPPKAMSNKQVVKKDGKTVVTYDSKKTGAFGMATYPAKVTKVYDNKGNLIRGNRRVQGSYGSSAMERIYDPKKKPASKPTPKPATKPTPKPASKEYGPRTKEVIKYMNPSNIKPAATKPAVKKPGTGKPTPKPATPSYGPKTTAVLDYMKPSNTLATKPKPVTPAKPAVKPKPKPVTPAKPAAKTVSEVWKEKTGMSWSEAKKQGLSDGSAKSNMELMKKLQSGAVSKDSLNKDSYKATMEKNVADEMSGKTTYDAPVDKPAMKKGGSVKRKMKSKKK